MDIIYTRISVFLLIFATVFCEKKLHQHRDDTFKTTKSQNLQYYLTEAGALNPHLKHLFQVKNIDKFTTESPNDTICVNANTTCLIVTSCPYVLKLLLAEKRNFGAITKLSCGYEGTNPKVCCPKEEGIPILYNTTEEIATNRPKGISTLNLKVTSTTGLHVSEDTNVAVPSTVLCDKISGIATELPNNPEMTNATCIKLTSCSYASQLLDVDTMNIKTIIKLSCGFEDKHPKICCPKEKTQTLYNTTKIGTNRRKLTSTIKSKVTSTIAPQTTAKTDVEFPSKEHCGKGNGSGYRIYGGAITGIDEHPWLARIGYKIDSVHIFGCSAALITDRYLLTAAHCVANNRPISIVRLGEWNTKTEMDCYNDICNNYTIDVEINKSIVHPTFNLSKGADGDIALIRLEESVAFTEFIRPICLPTTKYIANQDYSPDSVYFTAGWGLTELVLESDVKRQVELKAAPIEVCRNIYKLEAESEPNIICAGGTKGKDTCKGDSGGPLIKEVSEDYQINWYMFGITSLGSGNCGSEGVPGMFTRVSVYMDWIRAVVST